MQMKKSTSYALRIVLGLGRRGRRTITEMAEVLDIEYSYAQKILRKLRNAGYVSAVHGHGGGYELSKNPDNMSLWDIISAMEETTGLNRCLEEDHYCSRDAIKSCPVRKVYSGIQNEIVTEFSALTIAELMKVQKEEM